MTLSDLLHQTLRMSVTRVIVGEVRGAEALPMLEAMNAGMPGSMCTLHAGSAADAFERLVTAAMKGAGPAGRTRSSRGWLPRASTTSSTCGTPRYAVPCAPGSSRRWLRWLRSARAAVSP